MLFPIYTQNLILTRFTVSDIDDNYLSWLNNRELMKHSRHISSTHTRQSCLRYLETFLNSNNYFIAISHPDYGKIGTATIYLNSSMKSADIGLLIGDNRCQGKGYGKEAWTAIVNSIRSLPDICKITAGTSSLNIAMKSIIEKSGFSLISQKLVDSISSPSYSILSYHLCIE